MVQSLVHSFGSISSALGLSGSARCAGVRSMALNLRCILALGHHMSMTELLTGLGNKYSMTELLTGLRK